MKLYRINVQHCSPKDSHTSIECFLLARDEEDVFDWIDQNRKYDNWTETNDDNYTYTIYDDDYNEIGSETFKEKIIRIKGDINDEDQDWSDAHYGLTFYGWEEVTVSEGSIEALDELGILIRLEKENE
jgi:hypothetical protein